MGDRVNKIIYKATSRGIANHGWLQSHHTFSFANYYNPERMGFGVLRVINDDIVSPSMGFGTHPHQNMEIVSIPLEGSLKHKDTIGNEHIISRGEIQVMSAGTGLRHSEYNNSNAEEVNFLQIWILPKKTDIEPSYSQKKFDKKLRQNEIQLIVSPDARDGSVKINQDAYFSLVDLDSDKEIFYNKYNNQNGVYIKVLSGLAEVENEPLGARDGLGVDGGEALKIFAKEKSEVLIMEVPLENKEEL